MRRRHASPQFGTARSQGLGKLQSSGAAVCRTRDWDESAGHRQIPWARGSKRSGIAGVVGEGERDCISICALVSSCSSRYFHALLAVDKSPPYPTTHTFSIAYRSIKAAGCILRAPIPPIANRHSYQPDAPYSPIPCPSSGRLCINRH